MPSTVQSAVDARARWRIAFAAALMNALQSGSFFFTPTTLMPSVVADFELDLSLSTVPIAVGKVAYVLLLIPGGILVDQHGPRLCVLVGVGGLAAILTAYALFVASFWPLLCAHVALATVASVSGVPVYSIFIAQWFEGGIGLAMGLVLAGFSAAGTAVPALLGPIASMFGWRVAMLCMCGLLWFVALPVTYFFLHEKHDDELEQDLAPERLSTRKALQDDEKISLIPEDEPAPGAAPILTDTGMVDTKSWTFVGFAFSYVLMQYCFGCLGENIMFFLTIDRGVSLGVASLLFSTLNGSAFVAKLVGGHLGDRFDRFHVASAASGLAAVGIFFLFIGETTGLDEQNIPRLTASPVAMVIFAVVFGFGYGATFNCLYALTPIVFGKQNLGRTQSALFGLGLAGNAVGSVMTGVLRSKYLTYQRPFLVAALACTANFFVFNVTRLTLGGSLEGFKALSAEQEAEEQALVAAGTYQGVEAATAAERVPKQRLREVSELGISPRMSPRMSPRRSPPSSFPNLQNSPGTYGAVFMPLGGEGVPASPTLAGISRSSSRHSGTGMQVEEGFPIVRDWSSSSLRAWLRKSPSNQGSDSGSLRGRRIRKSSTMEAMIESGILSASLEAAGYLGKTSGSTLSMPSLLNNSNPPQALVTDVVPQGSAETNIKGVPGP